MTPPITQQAAHSRRAHRGTDGDVTPLVVALVVDRGARARLAGSLRNGRTVAPVSTGPELLAAMVAGGSRVHAVVVEPHDANGIPMGPLVAQIRRDCPAVAVLGYCSMRAESGADVVQLVRAGVHDVVFRDHDDAGVALLDALGRAERSSTAARVVAALRDEVSAEGLRLIEHGIVYGRAPLTVPDVAAAFGVSRRTLVDWCHRSRLFPPQTLLAWARLFIVGAMLESPGQTVERVAGELEYPSGPGLHNALRRHADCRAQEVRRGGGLPFLIDRFREQRRAFVAPDHAPVTIGSAGGAG